jgi:Fic family protein
MKNLEQYLNVIDDIDPLIIMAIIHYQFESIHPFYDGNGRTGRIINILFLVMKDLIKTPILYLSKYIYETKSEYYRLFNVVRGDDWIPWILYFLEGVTEMSKYSLGQLKGINDLFEKTSETVKEKLPKIYSKELIEIMFSEFYIRNASIQSGLGVTRKTAASYLNQLVEHGLLVVENRGRDKIYINERLISIIVY